MNTMFAVFALILAPVIGWLYGRNQIDPNTPEGRKYYAGKDKT